MASFSATHLPLSLASPLRELKTHTVASFGYSPVRRAMSGRIHGHPASRPISAASSCNPDPQTAPTDSDAAGIIIKEVPGEVGPPLIGPARDRIEYFKGRDEFFQSRMKRYNSTVIRLNMPPGPPNFPDGQTIMLLDQKSYPVLFDMSKVEKRDVFVGTYTPTTKFTGGFRVLPYLDPSEPKHTSLKNFCFEILKANGKKFLPEFHNAVGEAWTQWETELEGKGEASFADVCAAFTFKFLCKSIVDSDPTAPGPASLGNEGPSLIQQWIGAQLAPQSSLGVPTAVEVILHTVPVPSALVAMQYHKLYQFFATADRMLDAAEQKFSLDRVEACHNLLFFICFNTWGGFQIFYPAIFQRIAARGLDFQKQLAEDVRCVVGEDGVLTMKALESMELVIATVYEVLRMDAPVPFQYARAKNDMLVESHDAAYKVKKGELLGGYQKIAMRDPKVFEEPDAFKPERFMGADGKILLQNLLWSNGPESAEPSVDNKQCAGKDFVTLTARMLVAEFYLRYDSFHIVEKGASAFSFNLLNKRTPSS